MPVLHDNQEQKRFELELDGEVVFANYRLDGKTLYIDYVESPPALRGTGAAGLIMEEIKSLAIGNRWEIVPICGYAATWLKRHAGR
jgi:predicted GNAT family acetyltransferase